MTPSQFLKLQIEDISLMMAYETATSMMRAYENHLHEEEMRKATKKGPGGMTRL